MEEKIPELRPNMRGVWGDFKQMSDAIELLSQTEKWAVPMSTDARLLTAAILALAVRVELGPLGR